MMLPPFAILSHTWGDEECTLQDMALPDVEARAGYAKIKYFCNQALKDGLQWSWVDTCCIDKTSTAELSEAINSMFRWYQNAVVYYTFLADVYSTTELSSSRWFTRGWILQELIAPRSVWFYSSNWQCLGSKFELQDQLAEITGIEQSVLATGMFERISIARRMSWAAKRQTTRVEDLAYSLLGIFDVNMPLLYGEGRKSFTRLQEEIMKLSEDHSLFAWGLPATFKTMKEFSKIKFSPETSQLHRLLANSPADFTSSHRVHLLDDWHSDMPPMVYSNGVRIELPVVTIGTIMFAAISCTVQGHCNYYLGIPLFQWSKKFTARCGEIVLLKPGKWSSSSTNLHIKAPTPTPIRPLLDGFKIVPPTGNFHALDDVYCLSHATYSPENNSVDLVSSQAGPHVTFFFRPVIPKSKHKPNPLKRTYTNDYEPPLAIVIGGDKTSKEGIWAVLVYILSEEITEKDFHALFNQNTRSIQYCATKSQLISYLYTDQPFLRNRRSHFQHSLYQWKELELNELMYLRYLSLSVEVKETPINLVERGIVIHIDITKRWS